MKNCFTMSEVPGFRSIGLLFAIGLATCGYAQVTNGSFESGGGSFAGWTATGDALIETSFLGTGPVDGLHDALLASATDGSVNTDVPAGTGSTSTTLEAVLGLNSGSFAAVGNGVPLLGSAVSQTVTLAAGSTLSFSWDFLTNQTYNDGTTASYAPSAGNNDFAFFTLAKSGQPATGLVTKLADTFYGYVANPSAPGGFQTGFTITATTNPFISETGFHTYSVTVATAGSYIFGVGAFHSSSTADDGINSAILLDNVQAVPEPSGPLALGILTVGALALRRTSSSGN